MMPPPAGYAFSSTWLGISSFQTPVSAATLQHYMQVQKGWQMKCLLHRDSSAMYIKSPVCEQRHPAGKVSLQKPMLLVDSAPILLQSPARQAFPSSPAVDLAEQLHFCGFADILWDKVYAWQ